jgi:K+-transporting ATPase KdpF subunit
MVRTGNRRLLRRGHSVRVRLREALTMENIIVGIVSVALLSYLFWSLIRPESF